MFEVFAKELESHYPGALDFSQPWIYSIAGGAMIQMTLYYASLTEYVMIWGTAIGSEGHSGRHFTGFWDTVIDGEAWYYSEGRFEKAVYKPGDRIYVGPFQSCAMNFTDGVWAVEYARGILPVSLIFGIADEIISCLDFLTVLRTLLLYADLLPRSLSYSFPFLKWPMWLVSFIPKHLNKLLIPPPEVNKMPKKNLWWFFRKK